VPHSTTDKSADGGAGKRPGRRMPAAALVVRHRINILGMDLKSFVSSFGVSAVSMCGGFLVNQYFGFIIYKS
jgi:hypothetical protein